MATAKPKIKFNLKKILFNYIIEPEELLFNKIINEFVEKNKLLVKNAGEGFNFIGEVFWHTSSIGLTSPVQLDISLRKNFSQEYNKFKNKEDEVSGIVNVLLWNVPEHADRQTMRDALPYGLFNDALNMQLERINDLTIYTDKLNNWQLKQYEIVLDKLSYYLAMRMVT